MTRKELAQNLAQSLTMGAWSREQLLSVLIRRLPPALHRLAPKISGDLVRALPALYAPSSKSVATMLLSLAEFERIYRYCQRRQVWPDPDLAPHVMAPISVFAELDIPQLHTVEALSDWLLTPMDRLEYLADLHGRHEDHGDMAVNHYHYVLQAKPGGGQRVIEAPKETLKSVQRQILRGILDKIPTHSDAFGFVQGRNCCASANRHAGEEVVVAFDLRDFFPSVGAGRVFGLFRCLGYPAAVARYLTALCTTQTPRRVLERLTFGERAVYRQAHLPQGAPTSPSLANQVAFSLDRRLSALATRLNASYSRYADDLSFSGDRHIAGLLLRAVPQIVRDEGFAVNARKTRIMHGSTRQVVTGIVVNQHLNLDRRTYDRLKAVIHACSKREDTRLSDPAFRASLLGKIGWAETVNPNRGRKLRHLLAKACEVRAGLERTG